MSSTLNDANFCWSCKDAVDYGALNIAITRSRAAILKSERYKTSQRGLLILRGLHFLSNTGLREITNGCSFWLNLPTNLAVQRHLRSLGKWPLQGIADADDDVAKALRENKARDCHLLHRQYNHHEAAQASEAHKATLTLDAEASDAEAIRILITSAMLEGLPTEEEAPEGAPPMPAGAYPKAAPPALPPAVPAPEGAVHAPKATPPAVQAPEGAVPVRPTTPVAPVPKGAAQAPFPAMPCASVDVRQKQGYVAPPARAKAGQQWRIKPFSLFPMRGGTPIPAMAAITYGQNKTRPGLRQSQVAMEPPWCKTWYHPVENCGSFAPMKFGQTLSDSVPEDLHVCPKTYVNGRGQTMTTVQCKEISRIVNTVVRHGEKRGLLRPVTKGWLPLR